MTKEQKIEQLVRAKNEEVINRIKQAIILMMKAEGSEQAEGEEDYILAKAEVLKRMK